MRYFCRQDRKFHYECKPYFSLLCDIYACRKASIFLSYLNRHSNYPITYKMRNSTSLDEYFMYSSQEVLFTFEEFTINEGQYKNMTQDSLEITFKVSAEFNLPGLFVLLGDKTLKEKMCGCMTPRT